MAAEVAGLETSSDSVPTGGDVALDGTASPAEAGIDQAQPDQAVPTADAAPDVEVIDGRADAAADDAPITSGTGGNGGAGGTTATGGSTTGETNATGGLASSSATSLATGGRTTGGTATGGTTTGGTTAVGGSSVGGTITTGGTTGDGSADAGVDALLASVALEQNETWSDVASDSATGSLQVGPTLGPSYVLLGIAAHATSGEPGVHVDSVSGAGLSFARLAGGNIAGSPYCVEFWGARSSTTFIQQPFIVTLSDASDVGMVAWSLSGVNATSPVGATSESRQSIGTTYLETFSNTQRGSMLFGALFDGGYNFSAITPDLGSLVVQTNVAYFLYSSSAREGGAQSIGATLVDQSTDAAPADKWTIYRAAVEIVP